MVDPMSQQPWHFSWRARAVMPCLWASDTELELIWQNCRGQRDTSAQCVLWRGADREESPALTTGHLSTCQDTCFSQRTWKEWMEGTKAHTCWPVKCLVSSAGRGGMWRMAHVEPTMQGLGSCRRETFRQHWWGCAGPPALPLLFWRPFQMVIHCSVFNHSVNKLNVFLIHKYHWAGWFWFLVPAGVVMPPSSRKDAPTQLTGLVWRQRTLDAIPERHSWHRQVTHITPWPAARSDPGMGHPAVPPPCKLGH